MTTAIKFMKHYVTDGVTKARVRYSAFNMATTGEPCVTLYAKSFEDGNKLASIMRDVYENDTDSHSDYFEKGRARIKFGHPLYNQALTRAA